MTGSSSVVLSNLAYLIGAVVLAFIGGLAVWLHHRQPKSIDANVDAFQRGLQAIAPDSSRPGPLRPQPVVPVEGLRVRPRSSVTLQTVRPAAAPTAEPAAGDPKPGSDGASRDETSQQTAAGNGAGDKAGAETG